MIRVRQIKVPIEYDNYDTILNKIVKILKISKNKILNIKTIKKSIDARNKENIFYVYEVDVECIDENKILKKNRSKDVFLSSSESYRFLITGQKKLNEQPVIIGSGPSGLFCAYMLAEAGFNPLVIERGEPVEDRIRTIEEFFSTNKLDTSSNIQFGEGGAGTFSDGKLNTLVKDKNHRMQKVFEIFVENGAPENIMYENMPHIGTDVLRKVIVNIRNKIISLGGKFLYRACVTDFLIKNNHLVGLEINHKDKIFCSVAVLAIGHSARDTFYLLHKKGFSMRAKNFAVGIRIEHPQEMINKNQFGKKSSILPAASYKLTHQSSNGRGVYSFCMCPGGFVVNASSESGHLVVNGMSNYNRDERNANSAIVVTVTKEDFGSNPLDGIEFQRKLEKKAYELGRGYIPIQLFGDYLEKTETTSLEKIIPNTKGKYNFADLNLLFPEFINLSLKEAILSFDKKIPGFARRDAVLLGVESRTSSPIVIERDELGISNILGIYPCGEGAGYAGGITTAAIDGIKVAENIMKIYNGVNK